MSFSASFPENQDNYQPSLKEYALREQLYAWFDHAWDFILKETPESEWKTIKKYFLTKEKLWYKYTDKLHIIGVRFGKYTRHALVDLDSGSLIHPYTNEEAYRRAKWALEEIGLIEDVTVRSSESEGIHLCYFFKTKVPTFKLACAMRWALERAGFEIKAGSLELFPNTKQFKKHQKGKKREFSYYNGHRLPLQKGSYLLDKDFVPYSKSIEHFLRAADISAQNNDIELLTSTFADAEKWFKQKYRTYSSKTNNSDYQDWLNNSMRYISEGWTDNHQTNDLLLTIANVGVKAHGLEGEELAQFIQDTAISAPGYYPHCRHRHEIKRRCQDVARSAEKYWSAYPSRPRRSFTYAEMVERLEKQSRKPNQNKKKSEETSQRIADTIVHLSQVLQALPRNIKKLMELIRETSKQLFGIGVSDKTLRKKDNLPLWHPKYSQEVSETIETKGASVVETKQGDCEHSTDTKKTIPDSDASANVTESGEPTESIVVTKTPAEPQQEIKPPVPQKSLHSESLCSNTQSNGATPCLVVRKKQPHAESLESSADSGLSNRGYTLPFMKGNMGVRVWVRVVNFVFQVLQRAYCDALMNTPGLELLYLGFNGRGTNGLVKMKARTHSTFQAILPHSEVEIYQEDPHSSYFRENPRQILVYIKPIQNTQNWCNGIAVPIEHVVPVQMKKELPKTNNIYMEKAKNNSKTEVTNDKPSLYPEIPRDDRKSP
ncbi:MAG: hypothetical protein QNJ72_34660 [Pleurocapsa sp. MO_226.B13]|nr:hypothetical protein [Pleurocapsa sp. MO_226.B13]